MRYHVNLKGEVHECHAKKKCRFGGKTGLENHYSSEAEAMVAAQKMLKAKYGNRVSSIRKESPTKFLKTKNFIENILIKDGIKKSSELPNVKNQDEMISKWFNGNINAYKTMKRLSENPKKYNKKIKNDIVKMLGEQININMIDVKDFNKKSTKNVFETSSIDVIDDKELNKINIKDIKTGKIKAF